MAHHSTVLSQLLKLIPRHEFQTLANHHHNGQKLRKISRWDQFVSLFMAQLSGRQSLRVEKGDWKKVTEGFNFDQSLASL